MDKKTEFSKNANGVRVKHCCASCASKRIVDLDSRICAVHNCKVEPGDKCQFWQMSEYMYSFKFGDNEGRIHTPEWVAFVQANIERVKDQKPSELRKMIEVYEAIHGSRYLTIK